MNHEEHEKHEGIQFEPLSRRVIGLALEVHRELGPGLLESTYEACLARELELAGISFLQQAALPVTYKGMTIECGYRVDLLIENSLIIELKAVRELDPIHEAQLITYLKLSQIKTGLLINFNTRLLKNGIKRIVV
jgi:GxxExxY protein